MDRNQLLIGKIAEEMGYLTTAQLDQCVEAQRVAGQEVAIGQVMIERGFLKADQLDEVLEIQKERFRERDPHTYEKLEDILFGRLLVREGLVTEKQVREALRDQAASEKPAEFRYLGELLVDRGLIKAEDVARLLKLQRKAILYCEECLVQFNVSEFHESAEFKCKKCGGVLTAPPILSSVAAESLADEEDEGAAE